MDNRPLVLRSGLMVAMHPLKLLVWNQFITTDQFPKFLNNASLDRFLRFQRKEPQQYLLHPSLRKPRISSPLHLQSRRSPMCLLPIFLSSQIKMRHRKMLKSLRQYLRLLSISRYGTLILRADLAGRTF